MRTPIDSPFKPGSDSVPEIWAGRNEQLSDWQDILRPRRHAGLYERGRTILGEAGLGKSALVRRIASEAAATGDWVTPQLRVPSGSDPLKIVATALLKLAADAGLPASREKHIADALRRVQAVAASGVSLTLNKAEGPEPHTVLTELLIEIGRASIKHDNVILIHIDEVQNITNESTLSQLLIALGDALAFEEEIIAPGGQQINRYLPIAVYLTGLPEFADSTDTRQGATFARRFKTTTLTAIDDDAFAAAVQPFVIDGWPVMDEATGTESLIYMEQDAALAVTEICHGEPFLFQLAGEQAWYAGNGDVITRAQVLTGWKSVRAEAIRHVERILARLPSRESDFVRAMAELPAKDRTLTKIAKEIGFDKPSDAGPTTQRLDTVRGIITRGKPYTFRHRAVEAFLTSDWPDVP